MGFYRVTIEAAYLGQVVNNVLGIRGAGDVPSGVQAQDLAARVESAWRTNILGQVADDYVMTGVNVVSATNPDIGGFVAASAAGAQGTDPITGAVCVGVDIRTGFRGRAFRGRTGIAGLVEPKVTGNNVVEADRVLFQAAIDGFRDRLLIPVAPATEVYEIGVISAFKGVDAQGKPIPRVGGPIFTVSTSLVVKSRVGTRVSRLR
jgi:hypothetical protein